MKTFLDTDFERKVLNAMPPPRYYHAKGLGYQGRFPGRDEVPAPEAAHAASEHDDDANDHRPIPGAGPIVWLFAGIVALLGVAAVWHLVMRGAL